MTGRDIITLWVARMVIAGPASGPGGPSHARGLNAGRDVVLEAALEWIAKDAGH